MASIVTIDGIPVFDAIISNDGQGMDKISLVDEPAVMSDFLKFKGQDKQVLFAVEDEEKRLVYGVIMRADFPIYRRDNEMGEYYIIYKADTIRQMAEKYLADGNCNNINLMHKDGSDVEGVQMVQYFIKDSAMGVAPAGFDNIADGSLFGEFHVTNDEVWAAIKDGTYRGFSLEGYFDLIPEQDRDGVAEIVDNLAGAFSRLFKNLKKHTAMTKLEKIKAALAKVLVECANCTTDKGILYWDGDDDIAIDTPVFTDEAKETPAEDGEYIREDGSTIVIKDGKVSEIKEKDNDPKAAPAEGEGDGGETPVEGEETPADGGSEGEGAGSGSESASEGEGDGSGDGEGSEDNPDNTGGDDKVSDLEKRIKALETIVEKIAEWLGIIVVNGDGEAETFKAQMAALKAEIANLKKTPSAKSAHEEYGAQDDNDAAPKDRRVVSRKTLR